MAGTELLRQLAEFPFLRGVRSGRQHVRDRNLRGHPWIASFIFTRCSSACPVITARIRLLQGRLKDPDLRFVSFSVDPDFDQPRVLKAYAERWSDDPRWTLVSTTASTIAGVANGFKVSVEEDPDGRDPILHTSRLFLVDASNRVLGIYDSTDTEAVERLVRDASSLDRTAGGEATPTPTHGAAPQGATPESAGRELFVSLGCGGCHRDARVAPSLDGLYGAEVHVAGAEVIRADAAYIEDSILRPGHRIVEGYGPVMPGYAGVVSEEQVKQLTAYLMSLAATSAGTSEGATAAKDPVSGMTSS